MFPDGKKGRGAEIWGFWFFCSCQLQFPTTETNAPLKLQRGPHMWVELVVNYDHFFVLMDLKRLHHCDKPTTGGRQFSARLPQAAGRKTNTLAARGLEECASFPDFCDNRQFHDVIYCVSSRLCTLFRRISDSRFTWIHDFEE